MVGGILFGIGQVHLQIARIFSRRDKDKFDVADLLPPVANKQIALFAVLMMADGRRETVCPQYVVEGRPLLLAQG